jgi:ergothioneine biosynthesis protein EgtB
MMVQSCAEASPAKWHLAHTTWFFENFVLREFLPEYRDFDPDYRWLFNSYYNAVSEQPEKKLRSVFSRPSAETIFAYRAHVDARVEELIESHLTPEAARRITLGLNHEQQHQELLTTDIKHALWSNPLRPSYLKGKLPLSKAAPSKFWIGYEGGLRETGFSGEGFAFDCEMPRHREYLNPFQLASHPVSCAEYLEFIEDDGYRRPEHWLSAGWATVRQQEWQAPLYWNKSGDGWSVYTLWGQVPLHELLQTPVCHVSYFEADAFANWSGKRLPSESEWEAVAEPLPVTGNLLEQGTFHPQACSRPSIESPAQMYGDVWEWTASAFLGYPGFRPAEGALGEYNGKFMSSQMVLRGGSVATPASHIRSSYRNFFSPETRWQFSGIRLAEL